MDWLFIVTGSFIFLEPATIIPALLADIVIPDLKEAISPDAAVILNVPFPAEKEELLSPVEIPTDIVADEAIAGANVTTDNERSKTITAERDSLFLQHGS
jgi:hypothetical protein